MKLLYITILFILLSSKLCADTNTNYITNYVTITNYITNYVTITNYVNIIEIKQKLKAIGEDIEDVKSEKERRRIDNFYRNQMLMRDRGY